MKCNKLVILLYALSTLASSIPALALDLSVPAVQGDLSRSLLGDGTGVVIGVIDSGVDDTHPALAGFDSQGLPRMVAEGNFVPTEPSNTGDDVHGHGTWITSVVLSDDPTYTGMAPDARFINARVLDNGNSFNTDSWVRNGIGFAIENGADILNLSLNYFATSSNGNSRLDRMIDWAAYERGISSAVCVANINSSGPTVRGPGSAFNAVTVGRTDFDFDQVHPNSANAFTQDGRMKPDLVAPGTSITMANDDWETQGDFNSASGCSMATPHVAGLMAQQIEAGRDHNLSTSPLVIKTTMMNSASKAVLNKNGQLWSSASDSQPLDTHSGTGQIDGVSLAAQYLAGEQAPGMVQSIGWDLDTVSDGSFVDYVLNTPLEAGSRLTATLSWFRHMERTDLGAPGIDASDFIIQSDPLDNIDLQLLADGLVVAQSNSLIDTVEHLWFPVQANKTYTLRVLGTGIVGSELSEQFALAWSAISVPEPAAWVLMVLISPLTLMMRMSRHEGKVAGSPDTFPHS